MGYCQARYALVSDLDYYFKKADLLGGLTENEKSIARENLGISVNGDTSSITVVAEVTYAEFNKKLTASNLIPNKKYIITDYQTIYSSNVRNSDGQLETWGYTNSKHVSSTYRLIITALTSDKIDSRVVIDDNKRKSWVVFYDATEEVLPDGKKTKGRITYLRDDNNNSAYYDFKNVKYRRTSQELDNSNLKIATSYIDLYTFSGIDGGIVEDASNYASTKNNKIKKGSVNNVIIGSPYNNIIEEECENNTLIRSMQNSTLRWGSSNNLINELVSYTDGFLSNKTLAIGEDRLSGPTNKQIYKVNGAAVLSFFDPITYAQQIELL